MKIGDMIPKAVPQGAAAELPPERRGSFADAERVPELIAMTPLRWEGGYRPDTVRAFGNLRAFFLKKHRATFHPVNTLGSSQAVARAELVGQTLATDMAEPGGQRSFFVDADVVPTIQATMALLAVEATGTTDVVAVPYCSRVPDADGGHNWVPRLPLGTLKVRTVAGHRLLTVAGSGLGMTFISRRALVILCAVFPELLAWCEGVGRPRSMPCVFNLIVHTRPEWPNERRTGPGVEEEDQSFFARARAAGLRVEVLCDLQVPHADGPRLLVGPPGETYAKRCGLPPPPPV